MLLVCWGNSDRVAKAATCMLAGSIQLPALSVSACNSQLKASASAEGHELNFQEPGSNHLSTCTLQQHTSREWLKQRWCLQHGHMCA